MKLAKWALCWVLVSPLAYAQSAQSTPSFLPTPAAENAHVDSPRQARLLKETLTVAGLGLLLPMATYISVTQTGKSFQSFFTGFAVSTALGALVAPVAVTLLHSHWGGKGRVGRAVLGALTGIALGALVGLPLATLPNDGYHAGLGLLWALPATVTLVALEWG